MPELRDLIDTVVLVMMENRSFDHMLGHLSYDRINRKVNGLQRPLGQDAYKNLHGGSAYYPFRMKDRRLDFDLPHEAPAVASQIARSPVTGRFTMSGFVEAYARSIDSEVTSKPDPLGFFAANQVPITSFLAREFLVCNRWFAPLPTSTQPNRTIAFCGDTTVFDTANRLISCDSILFDWLTDNHVDWRVYHDGLSFFALYPHAVGHVLGDNFRRFESLSLDLQLAQAPASLRVIVVEPSYESGPHLGSDHPNDNHPPLAVGFGEEFLRQVYEAVTANQERWKKTVMIVYYDEHGGFWDHEPPPGIPYRSRQVSDIHCENMGPRVPAVVVSPLVEAGSVSDELFDHTSVLQLLAELATPGRPYSPDVEARRRAGIGSLSAVLRRDAPRGDLPSVPTVAIGAAGSLERRAAPPDALSQSFETAARKLMDDHPKDAGTKYPELFQWRAAIDRARR